MPASSTPAYYLMMIGGSLTIVTAIIMIVGSNLNAYYARFFPVFSGLNLLTAFALTLVPGLAVIYVGQRFLAKTETHLQSGIAVSVISIVSLVAIVGSGVSVYIGILYSGPPISFAGGLTGAFIDRAEKSIG